MWGCRGVATEARPPWHPGPWTLPGADPDAPVLHLAAVAFETDGAGGRELEGGLDQHSLLTDEDEKQRYRELINVVKEEYTDIVKNEVQKAIASDEGALARLCGNYIDNLRAYVLKEKVKKEPKAKKLQRERKELKATKLQSNKIL